METGRPNKVAVVVAEVKHERKAETQQLAVVVLVVKDNEKQEC